MEILIIENGYRDLIKSRKPLGSYLESRGCRVSYGCPDPMQDGVFEIPMTRDTMDVAKLICGLQALVRAEKKSSCNVVMSFRLIPNVLNFLSSLINSNRRRVCVVTGLGHVFVAANKSMTIDCLRLLIRSFYKMASRRMCLVVQNPDDAKTLGISSYQVVLGSGVKSTERTQKFHGTSLKLLFVGRLLESKGIEEAIAIFKRLKTAKDNVTLTIAGAIDAENPDSISQGELSDLMSTDGINYRGHVEDIQQLYDNANVLLFPSRYREGVPRVIIEALMSGLTIVTTNSPGCRETIRDNGIFFNEKDSFDEVTSYLLSLGEKEFAENFNASRALFKSHFSADVIYPQYAQALKLSACMDE